ncbi:MAG: universal stress protein [Deltaproteobacteria bacterium]|nr:universal stress protein [Deltaproteobacteria bacterium]
MPLRVLVPVDDSVAAHRVLNYITQMKEMMPMAATLLIVVPYSQLEYHGFQQSQLEAITQKSIEHCQKVLVKHQKVLVEAGVNADIRLERGNPAEVICRVAAGEGVDLVLISPNGSGKLSNLMFGSVANKVVQECHLPVLLVR